MLTLSIDTCGPSGAVALARVDTTAIDVLAQTELPGKTYSAGLLPAIRSLLVSHSASLRDLGGIVVTSGPGSFTGIRIGISTAKGLAELHAIPVYAVSRLAVLAHKAGASAAALDASRGEFYFGDFASGSGESLLTSGELREACASLGSSLAVCEKSTHTLAPPAVFVPPPTAADALHFALPRLRARSGDDPLLLDGNYLRRSDAEIFSRPKLRRSHQP